MRTQPHITSLLCVISVFFALAWQASAWAAEQQLRILATTFPVYQITRNIVAGADDVIVELMIPAQLGCPHDYALVPQDMRKLARADVLVINGLGMEEFLGAPVQSANPGLKIIDSSKGLTNILHYSDMETEPHEEGPESHEHDHHGALNPHLFASPRMVALMADNIARSMAQIHPAQAGLFTANALAYAQKMNRLADDLVSLGKRLSNNRIVTQHGVFDYLARDMGLEVVAVIQAHAGQNPAAADMLALVQTVKAKKAGAIFTEPQYPRAVGATIAKEASIGTAILDPVANGPEEAPLEYYQQVMRNNMKTLEKTLGAH